VRARSASPSTNPGQDWWLPEWYSRPISAPRWCGASFDASFFDGLIQYWRVFRMIQYLVSLIRSDERGQGLAEYALILALIAVLAIAALIFLAIVVLVVGVWWVAQAERTRMLTLRRPET